MRKQGSNASLGFLSQITKDPGSEGQTRQGVSGVMGRPERHPTLESHCMGLSSSLKPHTVPGGKVGGAGGQRKVELALQGASSGIHQPAPN